MFQQKYFEDPLKKTGMLHCKSMASPMNNNEKNTYIGQSGNVDLTTYKKKLVGGLLYLTRTRPDLMYVVGVISCTFYAVPHNVSSRCS